MSSIGRRSSQDEKWKEVRKIVRQRDKICQLCKVLLPWEVKERKKHLIGRNFSNLQCAHIRPVSTDLDQCYNSENILLLCSHCHYCQDHLTDSITGEFINQNKIWYYWWRAKYQKVDKYDKNIDYEELFDNFKNKPKEKIDWW